MRSHKEASVLLFECSIPGRVGIKKNGKKMWRRGKRLVPVSSDRYIAWEKSAANHLNGTGTRRLSPISGELKAEYTFHFKNHANEADVSNCIEGPQDLLQAMGIIENDKQIIELTARKIFDGTEKVVIKLYAAF